MKHACRCGHKFGEHVKSEEDKTILYCTLCDCEEYEEKENDADIWPDKKLFEDYERDEGMLDSEYLANEDKEILEWLEKHPPFVDKVSDDEAKNLK